MPYSALSIQHSVLQYELAGCLFGLLSGELVASLAGWLVGLLVA